MRSNSKLIIMFAMCLMVTLVASKAMTKHRFFKGKFRKIKARGEDGETLPSRTSWTNVGDKTATHTPNAAELDQKRIAGILSQRKVTGDKHKSVQDRDKVQVELSDEQETELRELYKQAEQLFVDNPNGRDRADPVESGDYYLKISYVTSDKMDNATPLNLQHFRINSNVIYYADKDLKYRGIFGSINLLSLLGPDDDAKVGRCCSKVGKVKEFMFQRGGDENPMKYQCFDIKGELEIWSICSIERTEIDEWRNKVINKVMAADLIANGITNVIPTSTLENNECQEPKNWNWVDQENWPCTCATGSDQSPLIINESEALEKISMRLQFRYVAMHGITATYNGHEVELLGDFGMLNFKQDKATTKYQAHKVQFKFSSEHQKHNGINEETGMVVGEGETAEMLVHHKDPNGQIAIMSVMIKEISASSETEVPQDQLDNKFLQQIEFDAWEHNNKGDQYCIQQKVDIDAIFHKREEFGDFYMYEGSESTPPCNEGVRRFVIRKPVEVTSQQLAALRTKAFNNDVHTQGNARIAKYRPQIRIFKYTSGFVAKDCHPEDEVAKWKHGHIPGQPDAVDPNDPNDPRNTHKFIRATSKITGYAVVDKDASLVTGDLGSGVSIDELKSEELDHQGPVFDSIKQKLTDDYYARKQDIEAGLEGLNAEQRKQKEIADTLRIKQLEERHAELVAKEVDRKMDADA